MRSFDDAAIARNAEEAVATEQIAGAFEEGKLLLVLSEAHGLENERNPHPLRRAFIEHLMSLSTHIQPIDSNVKIRAMEWQAVGIKVQDSLHLACAEAAGVAFLSTTDDNLIKRSSRLPTTMRIVTLPELVKELFP